MKKLKNNNFILIIIFIAVLYLPSITNFFVKDSIKSINLEKRNLAVKPTLTFRNITSFPDEWDNYYNDNLPYRNNIVNNWRNLHFKLLNESIDNRVILGKSSKNDIWIFFDNEKDGDEISFIDGRKKINYSELDIITNKLKQEKIKLNKKNIDIYYIICPNKSTIYSENLPKQIKVNNDYFLEAYNYFEKNGIDNMFYSTNIFNTSNKKYETYYRTDTHWNDYGSYIYVKEFLKKIYGKDIIGNQRIKYSYNDNSIRDLHMYSGISSKIKDNIAIVKYDNKNNIRKKVINKDNKPYTIYTNDKYLKEETILFIGDSFSESAIKHLSAVYKKVIYVQIKDGSYDEKMIEQYKPNKIIYMRVERTTPNSLNFEIIKNK